MATPDHRIMNRFDTEWAVIELLDSPDTLPITVTLAEHQTTVRPCRIVLNYSRRQRRSSESRLNYAPKEPSRNEYVRSPKTRFWVYPQIPKNIRAATG